MANTNFVESEFQRQRWALLAHEQAISALARATSEHELLQGVCKAVASQTPYILAWVGKTQHDANKTVSVMAASGIADAYVKDIVVSWDGNKPSGCGPAGTSIRTQKPSIVYDTETEKNFSSWLAGAKRWGIRSVISVPIFDDEETPYGAFLVYSNLPHTFNETETGLFQNFAKEIGYGLRALEKQKLLQIEIEQRALTQEKLTNSLRATIEAMSKTMEWRDPYTAGHQHHVANIAARIATLLKLSEEDTQAIYLAGMVHDIGKIAVPAEILTKPTHLTDIEMLMVRGHVEAGYEILKDIPFPWPIAALVHQHHERLDGSGYPQGLKGDSIVMGARILAVADTIEAMTTHRPYRPARTFQNAIDVLKQESGVKLDPKVVEASLTLFDDKSIEKLIAN